MIDEDAMKNADVKMFQMIDEDAMKRQNVAYPQIIDEEAKKKCRLVGEALLLLLQNLVALRHAVQHHRFDRVLLLVVDAAFVKLDVLCRNS